MYSSFRSYLACYIFGCCNSKLVQIFSRVREDRLIFSSVTKRMVIFLSIMVKDVQVWSVLCHQNIRALLICAF